jgi:hypothetical protein
MLCIGSEQPPLTREEWTSVLKLSTMWELLDIRTRAIKELSNISAVDKVLLGRECSVTEWVIDGYLVMTKASYSIAQEDAGRLGWETAFRLLRVREEFLMKMADKQQTHVCGDQTRTLVGYCNTCKKTISSTTRPLEDDLQQHDFMASLRYEFGAELALLEDMSPEGHAKKRSSGTRPNSVRHTSQSDSKSSWPFFP